MGNEISQSQMDDYREVVKRKFDDKEIRHMHKLFHKAAPDGSMGPTEFKKYIDGLGIFKRVDQQEEYQQLFRGYDRDGDKTITFKEYLLYHLGIVFSTEELFDIVFAMYDVNQKGVLVREDVIQVVTNSTRWMGQCDVESAEVLAAIKATVEQIFKVSAPLDKETGAPAEAITKEDLQRAARKHPEIVEKLKNLA